MQICPVAAKSPRRQLIDLPAGWLSAGEDNLGHLGMSHQWFADFSEVALIFYPDQ
jgi:hypothetical protein